MALILQFCFQWKSCLLGQCIVTCMWHFRWLLAKHIVSALCRRSRPFTITSTGSFLKTDQMVTRITSVSSCITKKSAT
uniref:Uncharacterized protein n=1 Tax=Panstrongylus lignarius TaxID=156445 RepID=A0A224Y4U7_9HEMI